MAAIRGREYVGVFFPSTQWVGLPLYKFSCLLHKLNDSGGCVVFAALLCRPAANPTPELNVDHIIIIIIIFICQNKHKQLQPTVFTIRQPENRTINKSGCLWLPLKYGINYTMNKTKKNYSKCAQQGAKSATIAISINKINNHQYMWFSG